MRMPALTGFEFEGLGRPERQRLNHRGVTRRTPRRPDTAVRDHRPRPPVLGQRGIGRRGRGLPEPQT